MVPNRKGPLVKRGDLRIDLRGLRPACGDIARRRLNPGPGRDVEAADRPHIQAKTDGGFRMEPWRARPKNCCCVREPSFSSDRESTQEGQIPFDSSAPRPSVPLITKNGYGAGRGTAVRFVSSAENSNWRGHWASRKSLSQRCFDIKLGQRTRPG